MITRMMQESGFAFPYARQHTPSRLAWDGHWDNEQAKLRRTDIFQLSAGKLRIFVSGGSTYDGGNPRPVKSHSRNPARPEIALYETAVL